MITNIVDKKALRNLQLNALKVISDSIETSAGPMGSDSQICRDAANGNKQNVPMAINTYTKDGHTILSSIFFGDIISDSVKANLMTITTNIVKKIGDGTTSAVLLSRIIFEVLVKLEESSNIPPRILAKRFKDAVVEIQKDIRTRKKDFTPETAYKIAYISSNGSEEVATAIKDMYEKYGKDLFIEVQTSPNKDSFLKEFDGMSLNTGYNNVAFMNDLKKGNCVINHPSIYYFKDPVDTREQIGYLVSIIGHNIVEPYNKGNFKSVVPTVIFAKHISKDASGELDRILSFMDYYNDPSRIQQKPPLLIVSNIHQEEELDDLARMCNCKPIQKYINADKQKDDQEKGIAPTYKNAFEFGGKADLVKSDASSTVVINPVLMHDDKGNLSETYKASIEHLRAELKKAETETNNLNVLGALRRRINSLNSKAVTYFIGGVTATDRDALKYLVDDAVLNCRSAATNGVGYAANTEGFISSEKMYKKHSDDDIYKAIYDSYKEVIRKLYHTNPDIAENMDIEDIYQNLLDGKGVLNIITEKYDKSILSSIETDPAILECISRIVTLMINCTQCILPNTNYNKYGRLD